MARGRSITEVQVCEECGEPIEGRRSNRLLCRRCEQALERDKRRRQKLRRTRRGFRWEEDEDDFR